MDSIYTTGWEKEREEEKFSIKILLNKNSDVIFEFLRKNNFYCEEVIAGSRRYRGYALNFNTKNAYRQWVGFSRIDRFYEEMPSEESFIHRATLNMMKIKLLE